MAERLAFTGEPAAFLVEWMRETERGAESGLGQLELELRRELKRSDDALLQRIEREVDSKVRAVHDALSVRVAEAQKAEREGRDALEEAKKLSADTDRRLRDSIGMNLTGQLGPAALGHPLGDLLRARLTRALRFRDQPPPDAWYVVGDLAFGTGDGEGARIRPPVGPEKADRYADTVFAAVLGFEDQSLDSFFVVHGCSVYGSLELARAAGEAQKAFVKTWRGSVTRATATEYCRTTWAAASAAKLPLVEWLKSTKSFTLVAKRDRTWVFDMGGGVDVATWSDRAEEAFQQLSAAGVSVSRGKRQRGKDDRAAHGDGFHLASDLLTTTEKAPKQSSESVADVAPAAVNSNTARARGSRPRGK